MATCWVAGRPDPKAHDQSKRCSSCSNGQQGYAKVQQIAATNSAALIIQGLQEHGCISLSTRTAMTYLEASVNHLF